MAKETLGMISAVWHKLFKKIKIFQKKGWGYFSKMIFSLV